MSSNKPPTNSSSKGPSNGRKTAQPNPAGQNQQPPAGPPLTAPSSSSVNSPTLPGVSSQSTIVPFGRRAVKTLLPPLGQPPVVPAAKPAAVAVGPPPAPYLRPPFVNPPIPGLETEFCAQITCFDPDGYVHIRPDHLLSPLKQHHEQWQATFSACENLDVRQLKYGVPCLVRYSDGLWYRATYLGMKNNLRHVYYEDFGTVAVVADGGYKATPKCGLVGYEVGGTVLNCRLAHPMEPLTFLTPTADDVTFLRKLVQGRDIAVTVVGYQSLVLHGRPRVVLLVDAITMDQPPKDLVTSLLEHNPEMTFKAAYNDATTFDSEFARRVCGVVQFPSPIVPPFGEKLQIRVEEVQKDGEITVSYVSIPEKSYGAAGSTAKVIYGDAKILASMEKSWTDQVNTLRPASMVNLRNSYLMREGQSVRRIEILDYVSLDDYLRAARVGVVLVDSGQQFDVDVEDILDYPDVISSCVAKQAFYARVSFKPRETDPAGLPRKDKKTSKKPKDSDKYRLLTSLEEVEAVAGQVVTAEFDKAESPEELLTVRLFTAVSQGEKSLPVDISA